MLEYGWDVVKLGYVVGNGGGGDLVAVVLAVVAVVVW